MKILGVKRFGLCFGAVVLLSIYASIATTIKLYFFLPVGLLILSLYIWIVVTELKGIYPKASKAIGQILYHFYNIWFYQLRISCPKNKFS